MKGSYGISSITAAEEKANPAAQNEDGIGLPGQIRHFINTKVKSLTGCEVFGLVFPSDATSHYHRNVKHIKALVL